MKRVVLAALAFLVLGLPCRVNAEDDEDHDIARDLHAEGRIRSLADILSSVGRRAPGDVVAINLVRVHDKWIYRLQIVSADGRRTRLDINASDGTAAGDDGDQ